MTTRSIGGPVQVTATVLSSEWGNLNKRLLGLMYAVSPFVDSKGQRQWLTDNSQPTVKFALSDCTLEAQMQYGMPFEQIGINHIAPLISAALQTGLIQTVSNALAAFAPSDTIANIVRDLGSSDKINSLAGDSALTKLNSTLIFNGMQPLKWTMTAHFRAWKDPKREVETPVNQIMSWGLPKKLSDEGFVTSLAKSGDFLKALFPSQAPQIVGFNYGNMQILPCIIESISQPITVPMDSSGNRLSISISIVMSTLGAIDKDDWSRVVL